jgi:Spy/CpxP family protein refolding chaperone
MRTPLSWTIGALFVCSVWAVPAAALGADACEAAGQKGDQKAQSDRRPEHSRTKWWLDAKWRGELGITDKQSANIDRVFEVEMVKLRAMREELNKLEATLAQMVKDDNASLAVLTEKWERVGTLLSESYKTRQLMIYKIHRELSVDQRAKLQAMFDRIEANRRQGDPNRRR